MYVFTTIYINDISSVAKKHKNPSLHNPAPPPYLVLSNLLTLCRLLLVI